MSTQPDPVSGREMVFLKVLEDMTSRVKMGKERYGHYLETHNGRDSLQDAYEEAIDQVMYLAQCIMERQSAPDPRQALFALCPPEARFIAQDNNGDIYWYVDQPRKDSDSGNWKPSGFSMGTHGYLILHENWGYSLIVKAIAETAET